MKNSLSLAAAVILILADCFTVAGQARILAHRGGRKEQDENTLSAFVNTYNAGCHGFETDVRFDADRNLVICHDNSLERMFGVKRAPEEMKTAELKKLKTKDGNPILYVDELAAFFSGCSTLYVEWEMKLSKAQSTDEALAEYCEKLWDTVMKNKPADALYVFSSFNTRPLLYFRKHHPEAEVMLISGKPCTPELIDNCLSMDIHRCACRINSTNIKDMLYAKEKKVKVNLWPGVKPETTALAFYLGADYLCTDAPAAVMDYIKEHSLPIMSK